MHHNVSTAAALLLALSIPACAVSTEAPADPVDTTVTTDQQAFTDGAGPLRGHEDVLRFGIDYANALIAAETGATGFYPSVASGDSCSGTTHPVLLGNCATDSPDTTMTSYYGVSPSSWQTAPYLQELHFLRNYEGSKGVEGANAACQGARSWIINATLLAMDAWQAGDRDQASYWLGHATHMVQDSFSAAHASRTGTLLRTITDVCSYGRKVNGVCYHALLDTRDRVWRSTWSCQLDPTNRSWSCLTPQAQSAALATAGYLRVVARHVRSGFSTDLLSAMNTYFDGGAVDAYTSYFHCEQLP